LLVFRKPKLETFARVAELAAAVAVVMSVIYLARQIADNTKLLRSQSHYNALVLGQRPLELLVSNDSLAGLVIQCDAGPEHVAAGTWERCLDFYLMQFNSWEYMYYENRDGSIPQEFWVGADAYYHTLAKTKPGYARFWPELRAGFAEPFRSYVDQRIPRSSPIRADQRP
jgi:hypothetical protein